jgi:hypothetical protein
LLRESRHNTPCCSKRNTCRALVAQAGQGSCAYRVYC